MQNSYRWHWKWWVQKTARTHITFGWMLMWDRWYRIWWVQRKPEPTLHLAEFFDEVMTRIRTMFGRWFMWGLVESEVMGSKDSTG